MTARTNIDASPIPSSTTPPKIRDEHADELETVVRQALEEALRLGADQAEVGASLDAGLGVTARLGDVENIEFTNDRGIGITVYRDHRKGSASTSDITPAAIRETVAKACAFADYTAQDKFAGLADADSMYRDDATIDLDLDHRWALDAPTAIDLAIACEQAATGLDKRIKNSEGATVSTNRGIHVYGNTHGFIGSVARTSHSISCAVIAEQDGEMQRHYHYSAARDFKDLESAKSVGEKAAQQTLARLGARQIPTTRAPVLFVPELARGFLGHLIAAISGGALYRNASFLLNALGEQLFPEFVQIQERPHLKKAMASAAYDAEGVTTYDRDIVRDGILQSYVLSSYSARRLDLKTTANAGGTQNLLVKGNSRDQQALMEMMGRGLIVEEVIGHGVNAVTGDYSRGVVGHWVENGKLSHPVHEVTIAGNLRDLYRQIVAIGKDQDLRGGIRCGAVLVDGMTIAGG